MRLFIVLASALSLLAGTTRADVPPPTMPRVPSSPLPKPLAPASRTTVIYISPVGRDTNPGTVDAPIATLAHARDLARSLKATGQAVTVYLRAGTYRLLQTIRFGPQDSGTAEAPITYSAFPGETAIIAGDIAVAGQWAQSGNIFSTRLPAGTWFQDLYFNGVRQSRSRLPSTGMYQGIDVRQSQVTFGYGTAPLQAYSDAGSATAFIQSYTWSFDVVPVSSIDTSARRIDLVGSTQYPVVPFRTIGDAAGTFALENLKAGITSAGQWSLDKQTSTLYFWPPPGTNLAAADIRGAVLPLLIDVAGDLRSDQWVQYLTFQDLTFQHSGRREFSMTSPEDASAVRIGNGARHVTFTGNTFTDLGAVGLTIYTGANTNAVLNNHFTRTGETAVSVL